MSGCIVPTTKIGQALSGTTAGPGGELLGPGGGHSQ